MFDLEAQIKQWRRAQGEALGGRAEVVDELESHLREGVQRLMQSGEAPESAWQLALGRLGSPRELAAEFDRVGSGLTSWRPGKVVLVAQGCLAVWLTWLLVSGVVGGRMSLLLAAHVFAITLGYATTFAVGALAAWAVFRRATGHWDARQTAGLRSAARWLATSGLALTAAGVALGAWWAGDNLGRMWAWDLKESGAAAVLLWGGLLLCCLWRRRSSGVPEMLLGVLGNAGMSLVWFGPLLLAGQHPYGMSVSSGVLWLVVFLVAQVLLVGMALLPAASLARWASSGR
jgi:hypothetical protein